MAQLLDTCRAYAAGAQAQDLQGAAVAKPGGQDADACVPKGGVVQHQPLQLQVSHAKCKRQLLQWPGTEAAGSAI
jgi:hypothetical protein